jgi:hypothetical protein
MAPGEVRLFNRIRPYLLLASIIALPASAVFGMVERPNPNPPPGSALLKSFPGDPAVLSYEGDTTWIQVHTDSSYCPGDPGLTHGGQATGGPGPLETWCFEDLDSCGTNPPWDVNCFSHYDVRARSSNDGTNFWHVDTYRADQRPYCGSYCLWCGADSLWIDGSPVDCNTWAKGKKPGYGNQWNCIAQLTLPESFQVSNGCTLYFDPRYDTECKYDYFYVDFYNGTKWKTLATFNASSNNPGDPCGDPSKPNPDYWGNTDTGQPHSADWQGRFDPNVPAFYRVLTPDTLGVTSGPMFRWRFTSDGAWSDQDGRANTDGGAFLDNVWICGDSERHIEDFESGTLGPLWSFPDPEGILDGWHMADNAELAFEYTACLSDSSVFYRARPEQGYPNGAPWRNGWYYRLVSPRVAIQNSGTVVQYDSYACALDYTCDYPDERVRFYNADYGKWCPWIDPIPYIIYYYPCFFWDFDDNIDVSDFYGASSDSVQFAWEIIDVSQPGDFCRGKHKWTQYVVDNVSIGFFDANATWFSARMIDILEDTFFDNLCGYNSLFDAYDADTVNRYSGPPYDDVPIPRDRQLYVWVNDPDGLASVDLLGSIDGGASWVSVSMTLDDPADPHKPWLGGDFYGTLCPDDFGLDTWDTGTEVWYYLLATDNLSNEAYWPARADPAHPYHAGNAGDYFTFSILPMYPADYTGPKILLVDGYGRKNYDYAECVGVTDRYRPLQDIYKETLTDAGYCYDVYDINGAWSNVHTHPIWFDDYDCVVWFTGPYYSNYLFDKEAQEAIRDYLGAGGKVVLLGDRIANNMAVVDEDSLGGEFLHGIMGCDYIDEVASPFEKPYIYAAAVESLEVFGLPVEVDLDTLLIYRECPDLKDMSYVAVVDSPPSGYTAQRLAYMTNADVGEADEVIYTEYQGVGQCVYVNFDLCGSATHARTYCNGDAAAPAPDFTPGVYDGRVNLMHFILEDIFDLPANGGGLAGTNPPALEQRWALGQNIPNPCVDGTDIRYEVARPVAVKIRVFNALGQEVRVLVDGVKTPGIHAAHWDGCNATGAPVSSGVYFYKMEAGDFIATHKMLVVR